MNIYINNFFEKLSTLKPLQRKFILLFFDAILIVCSCLGSFFLVSDLPILHYINEYYLTTILAIFVGLLTYLVTGQYKSLSRYVGSKFIYFLASRNLFLIFIIFIFFSLKNLEIFNIKFLIIFWLLLTASSGFLRFASRDYLLNLRSIYINKRNVAIFGIGSSSAQLYASLKITGKYVVKVFIDDDAQMWDRRQYGIPIIAPRQLVENKYRIDQVLIASEFKTKEIRKNFLKLLEKNNLPVMEIPTYDEMASGKNIQQSLKPINIEDLLGRDSFLPNQELLIQDFENMVILVTGGGGSIGSELCKQITGLNPKKLILIENNEANLYSILNQIKNCKFFNVKGILGSVCNEKLLNKIFSEEKVDIIFHSAAYKHVPIVEDNIIEGVKNNVISTRRLCKSALNNNVKKVVLISTDKAVRPTNVMGASKRLSEIIFSAFANYSLDLESSKKNQPKTIFSMVRFGNVLGSSGSVVPLFQQQISQGGPITLTDKNIERYFMTIPEAAKLVLNAASMSRGGELFLLDMGKPIKINYLAEQMIRLNGLKLKNRNNPDGDIEIKITGLRPGEKLYEELLVGDESQKTNHPLIFKDPEKRNYSDSLWNALDKLELAVNELDENKVESILFEQVPDWAKGKNFN